jgi:hypothetical protein
MAPENEGEIVVKEGVFVQYFSNIIGNKPGQFLLL